MFVHKEPDKVLDELGCPRMGAVELYSHVS